MNTTKSNYQVSCCNLTLCLQGLRHWWDQNPKKTMLLLLDSTQAFLMAVSTSKCFEAQGSRLDSNTLYVLAADFYVRDRRDKEPDLPEDPEVARKKRVSACTPRTAADGKGRTAGTVVQFWACGYMFPPVEMILSVSTTLVSEPMLGGYTSLGAGFRCMSLSKKDICFRAHLQSMLVRSCKGTGDGALLSNGSGSTVGKQIRLSRSAEESPVESS
jgi:hypothetical protein